MQSNMNYVCFTIKVRDGILIHDDIDGLAQHCSNSIANTLELLQSRSKPPIKCITISCADSRDDLSAQSTRTWNSCEHV